MMQISLNSNINIKEVALPRLSMLSYILIDLQVNRAETNIRLYMLRSYSVHNSFSLMLCLITNSQYISTIIASRLASPL